MKIIELLNRIANGEEVPKKIKKVWVYEWSLDELRNDFSYITKKGTRFDNDWLVLSMLDEEVEIIEEDKKIEKITNMNCIEAIDSNYYEKYSNKAIALDINTLRHQINKVIDYINKEK